jgi:hypothetical protein
MQHHGCAAVSAFRSCSQGSPQSQVRGVPDIAISLLLGRYDPTGAVCPYASQPDQMRVL